MDIKDAIGKDFHKKGDKQGQFSAFKILCLKGIFNFYLDVFNGEGSVLSSHIKGDTDQEKAQRFLNKMISDGYILVSNEI